MKIHIANDSVFFHQTVPHALFTETMCRSILRQFFSVLPYRRNREDCVRGAQGIFFVSNVLSKSAISRGRFQYIKNFFSAKRVRKRGDNQGSFRTNDIEQRFKNSLADGFLSSPFLWEPKE